MIFLAVLGVPTTFLSAQAFDLVIENGRVLDRESGLDAVRNVGVSVEPCTGLPSL